MFKHIYMMGVYVTGSILITTLLSFIITTLICHGLKFITDSKKTTYPKLWKKLRLDDSNITSNIAECILMSSAATALWPIAYIGGLIFGILYLLRTMVRTSKWLKVIAKISHTHPDSVKTKDGIDSEKINLWKKELNLPENENK